MQAERDGLAAARLELEKRLEGRDLELHDKEEELFLQLERVVRLEEDCEKVRYGIWYAWTHLFARTAVCEVATFTVSVVGNVLKQPTRIEKLI